jgi:hypothetical protein
MEIYIYSKLSTPQLGSYSSASIGLRDGAVVLRSVAQPSKVEASLTAVEQRNNVKIGRKILYKR